MTLLTSANNTFMPLSEVALNYEELCQTPLPIPNRQILITNDSYEDESIVFRNINLPDPPFEITKPQFLHSLCFKWIQRGNYSMPLTGMPASLYDVEEVDISNEKYLDLLDCLILTKSPRSNHELRRFNGISRFRPNADRRDGTNTLTHYSLGHSTPVKCTTLLDLLETAGFVITKILVNDRMSCLPTNETWFSFDSIPREIVAMILTETITPVIEKLVPLTHLSVASQLARFEQTPSRSIGNTWSPAGTILFSEYPSRHYLFTTMLNLDSWSHILEFYWFTPIVTSIHSEWNDDHQIDDTRLRDFVHSTRAVRLLAGRHWYDGSLLAKSKPSQINGYITISSIYSMFALIGAVPSPHPDSEVTPNYDELVSLIFKYENFNLLDCSVRAFLLLKRGSPVTNTITSDVGMVRKPCMTEDEITTYCRVNELPILRIDDITALDPASQEEVCHFKGFDATQLIIAYKRLWFSLQDMRADIQPSF